MTTQTKTFDCIEMKNRIQAEILAEYEARKDEFTSVIDFIEARAKKSEWVQRMQKKFRAQE